MVLDANVLIRAVLGSRVFSLLITYDEWIDFFAPDVAFVEAREHLAKILKNRGIDPEIAMTILESLSAIVQIVDADTYGSLNPSLANAFRIATWTTDRVELYFKTAAKS